jgi:hypothetical protein
MQMANASAPQEINWLLNSQNELPDYYRYYGRGELVAVIPALGVDHPEAQTYYSVPSLNGLDRLAPAFLFDDSRTFFEYGANALNPTFRIPGSNNLPFIFDSEHPYVYKDGSWTKSPLHNVYASHILKHPYAVLFHGGDDGHVGLRFASKEDMFLFLYNLHIFEEVFNLDHCRDADLHLIKNYNGWAEQFLSNRLEYHN